MVLLVYYTIFLWLTSPVFVFFRLYVNWRFMRGIEAQFLALQKGFSELIPQHLLKPFDHKELEVNVLTEKDLIIQLLYHWDIMLISVLFVWFWPIHSLNAWCLYWVTFLIHSHSSRPVDHRWIGEDRPCRLEDKHPAEALHKWKQCGPVVLAGGGGLQWGEERTPAAVRHRLH